MGACERLFFLSIFYQTDINFIPPQSTGRTYEYLSAVAIARNHQRYSSEKDWRDKTSLAQGEGGAACRASLEQLRPESNGDNSTRLNASGGGGQTLWQRYIQKVLRYGTTHTVVHTEGTVPLVGRYRRWTVIPYNTRVITYDMVLSKFKPVLGFAAFVQYLSLTCPVLILETAPLPTRLRGRQDVAA